MQHRERPFEVAVPQVILVRAPSCVQIAGLCGVSWAVVALGKAFHIRSVPGPKLLTPGNTYNGLVWRLFSSKRPLESPRLVIECCSETRELSQSAKPCFSWGSLNDGFCGEESVLTGWNGALCLFCVAFMRCALVQSEKSQTDSKLCI